MSNPFAKSRPQHQPYAIYRIGDFIWRVCKTYSQDPLKPYGRFFVWASSPMTYGLFEGGDAYAAEILNGAHLVACEPEWFAVYGRYSVVPFGQTILPTPQEYIKEHAA